MDKIALLNSLYRQNEINSFSNPLYIQDAKQFVPGYGNAESKILFIGEAPGEIEENTGRPFQGRSGKLLRTCLEKNGFTDETVFITNVVKFRPPQNRKPTEDEIVIHYELVLQHE